MYSLQDFFKMSNESLRKKIFRIDVDTNVDDDQEEEQVNTKKHMRYV